MDEKLNSFSEINNETLRHKIRSLLLKNINEQLSLERIAAMLCMSSRTLRRQLSQAETTFQIEFDAVREHYAIQLLEEKQPITNIALLLGYNDTSAFSRAFKRWTGVAPSHYFDCRPL